MATWVFARARFDWSHRRFASSAVFHLLVLLSNFIQLRLKNLKVIKRASSQLTAFAACCSYLHLSVQLQYTSTPVCAYQHFLVCSLFVCWVMNKILQPWIFVNRNSESFPVLFYMEMITWLGSSVAISTCPINSCSGANHWIKARWILSTDFHIVTFEHKEL